MIYALGRNIEYYDMPTVRRIAHNAAQAHYRFASIVSQVVASDAFRRREAPPTAAPEQKTPSATKTPAETGGN